jgi:hypothetical protein
MAKLDQLACPMMGRTAGFHPDKTLGQLGEDGQMDGAPSEGCSTQPTWHNSRSSQMPVRADESRRRKVKLIDKGVNEPHRVVHADVIVDRLRQQQKLRTFVSGNVRHAPF